MPYKHIVFVLSFIIICNSNLLFSQETYSVQILHSDSAIMESNGEEILKKLIGNVKLKHNTTLIDCDTAIIHENNNIEAYGNVSIRKNSKTKIVGEFLQYYSNQKLATIHRNVILTNGDAKLYTEDITYDLNHDIGYYMTGGKLVNKQTSITSLKGTFFSKNNLAVFQNNVHLDHPDYKLDSDSLIYDTKKKRTQFTQHTKIVNDSGYILCNTGWHDEDKNQSSFGRQTVINTPPQWIRTDSIFIDDKLGISHIYKIFEYHDTASKFHLFGDTAVMDNKQKIFKAYHRPTLFMESADDKSTFIKAEILESREKKGYKELYAYDHVRIYNESFQGTSNFLSYTEIDSTMYLTQKPILWFEKNQITGDTIIVMLENKNPKELDAINNALLVQEETINDFNQISADTIYIYIQKQELNRLEAINNAKSIYYAKEVGKGYLGLNNSKSYRLKAQFDSSKVSKITFFQNPTAIFYPVDEITDTNKFLINFVWHQSLRPKSEEDLD